jgi:hypothetical protein
MCKARLLILSWMTRAGADVREAKLVQDLAHRARVAGDAEALGDETLKINTPLAHDAVDGPVRSYLDQVHQLRLLVG